MKKHRSRKSRTVRKLVNFWKKYWGIFVAAVTGLIVGKYFIPLLFS